MEITNLTPHDVVICDDKGTTLKVYKPSGLVARFEEERSSMGLLDGVNLYAKTYGVTKNLPQAVPGKIYIVSSQVVESERGHRTDLIAPDELVRDTNGRILGCKSFWYGG